MKDRPKISQQRFDELNAELKQLEEVERGKIAKEMADARAQGDLSENSEYHAAKHALRQCDSRIDWLKRTISQAEIINESETKTSVCLGCTVILEDKENNKSEFIIVDPIEANVLENKISKNSPLGSVLFGKEIGEKVKVKLPDGETEYKIIRIF